MSKKPSQEQGSKPGKGNGDDEVKVSPAKVLFITKFREGQSGDYSSTGGLSSGLLNSATFVSEMLNSKGIDAKVVQVQDNNAIDREVSSYKPTHCFIEALWVVPSKLAILTKLHPNVKWVIRLHSNTSFAAMEGNFTEWVQQYLDYGPNVFIQANAHEMFTTLELLLENKYSDQKDLAGRSVDVNKQVSYLPNYYPVSYSFKSHKHHDDDTVNVGCFGAIRPLKNTLIQAVAAIRFAEGLGKDLVFHVNAGRVEGGASPVLKNLQGLFANQPNCILAQHNWVGHDEFLEVIRKMDVCSQVSFSETFNICSADAVNQNVPVVVSKEISWIDEKFYADPTSVADIAEKMRVAYHSSNSELTELNKEKLARYSQQSEKLWLHFLKS